MDLQDYEGTSTYAIQSVYDFFWKFIPQKYRLPEDDLKASELQPFYDPLLTFENRLHYKLQQTSYPNRAKPWFVITWNTENGLIKSSLNQRRYLSKVVETEKYGPVRFKFINTELQLNLCITTNSMQGLYELQENIVVRMRDKLVCYTKPHSILGSFPVALDVIDSTQNRPDREKGTLCYLMLTVKVDYPIIGSVEKVAHGIIKEIHSSVRNTENEEEQFTYAINDVIQDNNI